MSSEMRSEPGTRRLASSPDPPAPDVRRLATALARRRWGRFVVGALVFFAALAAALPLLAQRHGSPDPQVELAVYEFGAAQVEGVSVSRTWVLLGGSGAAILAGEIVLANPGAGPVSVRVREVLPEGSDMGAFTAEPTAGEVLPPSRSATWTVEVPGGATIVIRDRVPVQPGELAPAEALSRWAAAASREASGVK